MAGVMLLPTTGCMLDPRRMEHAALHFCMLQLSAPLLHGRRAQAGMHADEDAWVCVAQLVLEVVQQLQRSFQPDIRLIKKRIEDLIQRDFLERDKDQSNTYRYLA